LTFQSAIENGDIFTFDYIAVFDGLRDVSSCIPASGDAGYRYIAVFDGFGSNLGCLNLPMLQIIFQRRNQYPSKDCCGASACLISCDW